MEVLGMRLLRRVGAWVFAGLTLRSPGAHAQDASAQPAPSKPEELEALVAPIALYPDSVLPQVLMASTCPLEIMQAVRWVKANPNVKGDAALKAFESRLWDVSVKSLVASPQALEPMNDKLDWTQRPGDAFLAQAKASWSAMRGAFSNAILARTAQPKPRRSSYSARVRVGPRWRHDFWANHGGE